MKADTKKVQNLIAKLIEASQELVEDNPDAKAKLEQYKQQLKNHGSEATTTKGDLEPVLKATKSHVTELPENWKVKTVKSHCPTKRLNSPSNPAKGIRRRPISQKAKSTSSPARRTVKSTTTSRNKTKSSKVVSQADKKVECSICHKKVAFRNLSKHRKKEHPQAASKSAKKGAQVRIATSSRSGSNTQDTLQRMEDLKRQVSAIQKRSK